jgi:hypothetical protein
MESMAKDEIVEGSILIELLANINSLNLLNFPRVSGTTSMTFLLKFRD